MPQGRAQHIGLVLSGGGARAAYQVGVLRAIADILPADNPNPFDIICGTSAGALNAALFPLIDGLERCEHGDGEGDMHLWSPELEVAYGALIRGDDLVEAWRLFAQLPEEERERVIAASHWPM